MGEQQEQAGTALRRRSEPARAGETPRQQIRKAKAEDSAGLAGFINDEQNVLLETDSGGATQVAYTLEPASYGNLISQRRGGDSAWHLFDALGSTERLTDPSQAALALYLHTAFGVPKAATGDHPNPYRWIGRLGYRWEGDTGQYDVRRRRVDALRGRWLTGDPLRLGRNWYAYASARPTAYADVTGLAATDWDVCEAGTCEPGEASDLRRRLEQRQNLYNTQPCGSACREGWAIATGVVAKCMSERWSHCARAWRHFLGESGADLTVDLNELIRDTPRGAALILRHRAEIIQWARRRSPGNYHIADAWAPALTPRSKDWWYAVGSYGVWPEADVVVARRCHGPKIRIHYKLHLVDPFWWPSPGQDVFWAAHLGGAAQEFLTVGTLHRRWIVW